MKGRKPFTIIVLVELVLSSPWPLGAADPSPEICAKVREARKRLERSIELDLYVSKLRRLAAEERLLLTRQGYSAAKVESIMANTNRRLAEDQQKARDARAAYERLADDLIGKVETCGSRKLIAMRSGR